MCDSDAGLVGCGPAEPPSLFPSRPCSSIRKRSAGLQRKSHTRELPRSIAWLRSRPAIARIIVAIAPIVCHIAVSRILKRPRAHKLRGVLSPPIGSADS